MILEFLLSNPEHWRERAKDIRVKAVAINDAETKARTLQSANGYEMLGRQAEERLYSRSPVRK
jgi:hypothetical protein